MRIVFAGTPDFAAQTLTALLAANYDVVCVYTQPDRKTGRGQKLSAPPVKKIALEHDIEVRQPLSLKDDDSAKALKELKPDVMIVVAYSMLLSQRILDIPTIACLNIHASLLPRWRGAAPIQRAIEAGDTQTGVCIMQMEAGLDTGPVLLESRLDIQHNDTSASLHDSLAILGAKSLMECLKSLPEKLEKAQKQNHENACYAHKITKNEANIDWSESAKQVDQKIRAFNPWPICQSNCQHQRLRIWQAEPIQSLHTSKPGTVLSIDKGGMQVACGNNALNITLIQRDGSKPVSIKDFINSTNIQSGDIFET
ncbi:MAG: methionyl-tRNA formyltransferase [Arenicella sp.]